MDSSGTLPPASLTLSDTNLVNFCVAERGFAAGDLGDLGLATPRIDRDADAYARLIQSPPCPLCVHHPQQGI